MFPSTLTTVAAFATLLLLVAPSVSAQAPQRNEHNNTTSSSCKNSNASSSGINPVIPLASLPALFQTPPTPKDTPDYTQIQNTLSLYPLAIDGKSFTSLNLVFTPTVTANLSQGPIISGLPALEAALAASVAKVDSHHQLGTEVIDVKGDGCGAESVTYFHASLIGKGGAYGQIVYALGQYQDSWVKLDGLGWRIQSRNLVYMAPFIGNVSIVE